MTLQKTCTAIEHKLLSINNEKLVKIFNKMFPEEILESIDDDDFKEEIVQSIIEHIEEDETAIRIMYKKLFNEKISIEDVENYFDEEY
jgi:hypothetical protein